MPIDVEHLRGGTLIHVRGRGVVDDEEYRAYIRSLYTPSEQPRQYRGALVDWSQVTRVEVSREALRETTRMHLEAAEGGSRRVAVALVAPGALAYSLAREWERNVEETRWRTRVFKERGEAEAWLEGQLARRPGPFPDLGIKLDPPGVEGSFRQSALKEDLRVAAGLMVVSVFFQLFSIPTDLDLLSGTLALPVVEAIRMVGLAAAVAGVLLLRRDPPIRTFDRIVFLWALVLMGGVASANALLPPDYTIHVAWDLFLVLAAYAVLPLSLTKQTILAVIMTVADILLFWLHKDLAHPVAAVDVAAAFVCANLVGLLVSRERHLRRRREFLSLRREQEVGAYLQDALREIKTLEGIIPICSHCKKIRTDEGFWERVEVYVGERSGAAFSHGICPDCMREYFPEETDEAS